LLKAVAFVH
jgi:hypothetical protein